MRVETLRDWHYDEEEDKKYPITVVVVSEVRDDDQEYGVQVLLTGHHDDDSEFVKVAVERAERAMRESR